MTDDVSDVLNIVKSIRPLLAGRSPDIQGAVLADLLAMYLAGYQGSNAGEAREEILRLHIDTVRDLIPINEKLLWGLE